MGGFILVRRGIQIFIRMKAYLFVEFRAVKVNRRFLFKVRRCLFCSIRNSLCISEFSLLVRRFGIGEESFSCWLNLVITRVFKISFNSLFGVSL